MNRLRTLACLTAAAFAAQAQASGYHFGTQSVTAQGTANAAAAEAADSATIFYGISNKKGAVFREGVQ